MAAPCKISLKKFRGGWNSAQSTYNLVSGGNVPAWHQRKYSVMNAENSNKLDRRLVNKKRIARRFGVSERTIQDWMESKLPHYKVGYLVRFDEAECDAAMERFKINPPEPPDGGSDLDG
jgi:excisionase family DNA binding protein